ncbi:MAG: 4-hydroxy-tetrahydrodipicolinate synthase [Alphaproteobacteria bacterium]
MVKLHGSIPALITPMLDNREVDKESFEKMVAKHLEIGTHGLVPMGTTGESPTLSHAEHKQVVDMCIQMAGGKIPVAAGTGSNSTREAIELTSYAKLAGADAALIVVPYYNKPNQEGMYQHFASIAREVDLPIVVYNIPGRSVVNMEVATFMRLKKDFPDVFTGVKDATGKPEYTAELMKAKGDYDVTSLCGDDGLFHEFVKAGSTGTISVTANVIPEIMVELHNYRINGEMDKFNELQQKLIPLHDALFAEPNPCPAKYAMKRLGLITDDQVRLPMVKVSDETKQLIDKELSNLGLL